MNKLEYIYKQFIFYRANNISLVYGSINIDNELTFILKEVKKTDDLYENLILEKILDIIFLEYFNLLIFKNITKKDNTYHLIIKIFENIFYDKKKYFWFKSRVGIFNTENYLNIEEDKKNYLTVLRDKDFKNISINQYVMQVLRNNRYSELTVFFDNINQELLNKGMNVIERIYFKKDSCINSKKPNFNKTSLIEMQSSFLPLLGFKHEKIAKSIDYLIHFFNSSQASSIFNGDYGAITVINESLFYYQVNEELYNAFLEFLKRTLKIKKGTTLSIHILNKKACNGLIEWFEHDLNEGEYKLTESFGNELKDYIKNNYKLKDFSFDEILNNYKQKDPELLSLFDENDLNDFEM